MERGASLRHAAASVRDESTPVGARALVGVTLGVLLVAVACALLAHHSCVHAPPPVEWPEPGTPRADYCRAVDRGVPWLAGLAALAVAVPVLLVVRRWGAATVSVVTILLCAACLALAVVAGALESAYTI
jgi:hypothetical protein